MLSYAPSVKGSHVRPDPKRFRESGGVGAEKIRKEDGKITFLVSSSVLDCPIDQRKR